MTKSNKSRKFIATSATAALVAAAIVPVASAAQINDFNSISSFAQEAVQDLNDRGIIKGDQKGNFNPRNNVTRAEAATILTNALGLEGSGSTSFNDVKKNAWYYDAIDAAVANGIFQGQGAGKFNPSGNLTRSEAAIILVDAFGLEGSADLSQFKDSASVKSWAQEALEIAVANEVMKGDAGNLKPNAPISRQEFAVMYSRTEALEVAEETVSGSVKAINNTTVEVTFEDAVVDVKALDFAIEGLTVSNAVVKQTDSKTVVLTTSAQTADVTYTVTVDGAAVGTFKGVSAVIPTKVELVTSSVQGKLGQQVSVQAKVTVAEGASKAGIPVTFSIPGNTNDAVTPTVVGEAVTNAEGVATFTYTRYKDGQDTVTAYATGDRSKFAIGYVFWGVDTILAITEVTEGANINNGANKTYKITYKHPETGKPVSGKTFNVGFLESMDVTSDKVSNATINGVNPIQLSNGKNLDAAEITTDSKGEATFTVSGTNTAVTPVVFDRNPASDADREKSKLYKASALQATAAKVTFGAVQADYKIEVTREGGEVAAIGETNGREYKIVVKDKDGKVAKNEIVNVAFNEDLDRVISTNTKAKFINTEEDDQVYYSDAPVKGMSASKISVKTNDKGEATFVIGSDDPKDYATPIAWIDINTADAKDGNLDEGEPKTIAPISYFQEAYLDGSAIKSYKQGTTKAVTKFDGDDTAVFQAELVNQSGKKMDGTDIKKVTYTIYNTGANDIEVEGATISPNRSKTVTYTAPAATDLVVTSIEGKTTSVKVIATGIAKNTDGKDYAFTSKETTATFTSTSEVGNNHTGAIEAINTSKEELKFVGKKAVSIKDAKFFGSNGADLANFDAFVQELKVAAANNFGVVATYLKDKDGKVTVKIVRTNTGDAPVKFDEKSSTLKTAAITKQLVVGTATTEATATIAFADIDADNDLVVVNGETYKYSAGATASETGYYDNAQDLVNKINAAKKDVKATLSGTDILLTGKADGSEFTYAVNGTETTTNNGTKGELGNNQQLTLTFSSAINVDLENGTDVFINTVAGATTANAKVISVSTDNKSIVIELNTGVTSITSGTTVNFLTVGTNNDITLPTGVDAIKVVNGF